MISRIGGTERRVILALVVTAVLPLLTAMWLANEIVGRISQTAFQPEFGQHLERSLGVYKDLVGSMKTSMRHEGASIANQQRLRRVVASRRGVEAELARVLELHPALHSIEIVDEDDEPVAQRKRDAPTDRATHRPFTVRALLSDDEVGPAAVMVFLADRRRLDEMEAAHEFSVAYKTLEGDMRAEVLERPYLRVFAVLFGLTVLLAILTGILVVRPVTRRIGQLAAATRPVAEGDLSVRVDAHGNDELSDLARAFNQMLEQLGRSRARIEFLKRVGQWQAMARRLAHEIKNPLTPIQLAVEECHRRYDGSDAKFQQLLATTLDIVEEEVASLRRLVGEFAEFARLPRAALRSGDLGEFLRDQRARLEREDALDDAGDELSLELDLAAGEMPIAFDRTMLYRVLSNLVRNAAQATGGVGTIVVKAAREGDHCHIDVEDDGPGIDGSQRISIFDPYMTTKQEGTGLGLTICKKVIIDHGGHIDVDESALGGARFRVRLPCLGTSASDAALSRSERAPLSG